MLGSTRVSLKLFAPPAVLAVAVLGLLPGGASGASQIGSGCIATDATGINRFVVQVGRVTGQAFATTAPGVVTKWAVNSAGKGGAEEKLKVLLPKSASSFEAIGESAMMPLAKSVTSEFLTRIPVPAGAIFGAFASEGGVPYCAESGIPTEPDKVKNRKEDIPLNVTGPSESESFSQVLALRVTIEPDADGDGYGDESQDGCPTNVLVQGACPITLPGTGNPGGGGGGGASPSVPTSLAISSAKLEGNTVAVKLSSTVQAQVTVIGTVKGKQAAPTAKVTVVPGAVGRAYLTLSKALRGRLAKLPRKGHLTLVIEAQAPGAVPASRELPLPGRKKVPTKHRSTHRKLA